MYVLEQSFRFVAFIMIFLTMALTSIDALGRYLLGSPLRGSVEIITEYALPIIVFLAAAHAYRNGNFIRVTALRGILPARVRVTIDLLAQILSALIVLVVTFSAGVQAIAVYRTGALSNGVYAYPLWPAYWFVLAGLTLLCFFVVADLARVSSGKSGLQIKAKED